MLAPMATTSPQLPEQGQLVDVRQRRYVVTEVEASTLPTSPLRPAQPVQHLVSLASVEDDALGEELQVVWEMATQHLYCAIRQAGSPKITEWTKRVRHYQTG